MVPHPTGQDFGLAPRPMRIRLPQFRFAAAAGGAGRQGGTATDERAYKVLVDSLYSSPGSIVPGGIAAVLTCYLCYRATDEFMFAEITGLIALVVILRLVTIVAYRRRRHLVRTIPDLKRWSREFLLGGTVLSLTLGLNSFLTLTATDSPSAHLIAVSTNIAFASGYVARNAGRPMFVMTQLVLFCGPMAIGLLMSPDVYYNAIGYFTFLFVASNVAITLSVHRNLVALGEASNQSESLAEALRVKNITLDAALNNMNFGLAMFDRDLRIAVRNRRFVELYQLTDGSCEAGETLPAIASDLTARGVLSEAQAGLLVETSRRVSATGEDTSFEIVTGGRHLVVTIEGAPDGGVLSLTEDATERRVTEARIERLARFDELTGLANRFELSNALSEACNLNGDGRFALLYVDLDNFKQVNDNFGHEVGDGILVEASRRLRLATGPGDLVARFGGDEFVLIHPGPTRDTALALGQRVVDGMSAPFGVRDRMIYATASVGIAFAPEHGRTPSDILRHADVALYKAKAAGRSTFAIFSPEMSQELAERHELEVLLRRALDGDELELFYQPIVDLGSGIVVAYEALSRWRHPVLGMVSPALFIPIAEQTGLIKRLGENALKRACRDAAFWPGAASVSVNVSPMQFRNPDALIATVKDALKMSRLAPERLSLEITESVFIEHQDETLEAIHALRRLGVRFSLDDFGSGYSSLAYLSKYPFSQVKVDRNFAQSVTYDATSQAIIETVGQLARRLGMLSVVEGIETVEQLDAVRRLGAELAQGYLFGRPEPIASIPTLQRRTAA